jgi:beta-xylosidase
MNTMNLSKEIPGYAPHSANPVLPGYYADPSILQEQGKVYIYGTIDPWGSETLGCWESSDWRNWTYRVLNWPTKAACASAKSKEAMVWAPSVVKGRDGRFYMYVSVGSEVWAGVADQPLGPWRNLLGGQPLIAQDYKPGYHMIDAEAFIDDDGLAYLYWGSGLNWVNGRCWAAKLKKDMKTFDGEVRDIPLKKYFEAPFMFKRQGLYYLMYSAGNTTKETYCVGYGVGSSPFGPFTEPESGPILTTDKSKNVISPGHHAVFTKDGKEYILYHRQSIPFDPSFIGRQVCVDELRFGPDGAIEKVVSTHEGEPFHRREAGIRLNLAVGAKATASSQRDRFTGAEHVLDDNYATRWMAAKGVHGAWLQLDLDATTKVTSQELRPEYAWKPYRFTAEFSNDGVRWEKLADFTTVPAIGSPITIDKSVTTRFLRLVFPDDGEGAKPSIIEWAVY